jgi:hypothetical protein
MSSPVGLNYVGPTPQAPSDITNKLATTTTLNQAPTSQSWVSGQVASLVTSNYMAKSGTGPTFASPTYATAQKALLVPSSAAGAVNQVAGVNTALTGSYYGVATLDGAGRIPVAQVPVSGSGYILGPFGPTATGSGVTNATPIKVADWHIGTANYQFRVWVYLQAMVTALMGHPIIEIRMANSATAPASYATAGTLVALGEGRNLYNDYHPLATMPVPDTTSQTPSLLPTNYNIWLSAWLYDQNGQSVELDAGSIYNAAAYLVRGAL